MCSLHSSDPQMHSPRKSNTTSLMYICGTLDTPNLDHIITCVAKSIHTALHIHSTVKKPSVYLEIFDERKYPLINQRRNFNRIPLFEETMNFVKFLFLKQALSPQVGIMAIHYIDQLIQKTGLLISPVNWRRILLCALLLADKVWEEDVVCNSDYCNEYFPRLTVEDINLMERKFLSVLDFKLVLTSSVYAEYYFALRSMWGANCVPLHPLDKETAVPLLRKAYSAPSVVPKRRRSISVDSNLDRKKHEETCSLSYEQFSERLVDTSLLTF